MLKKKMKGVMFDSSPSYVEEAKTRYKFQTLMHDYQDLHKETEAKKRKIQVTKRRSRVLLSEVGFLRQRYEELMEYKSREQEEVARIKTLQAQRDVREVALRNPAPVLDLNQIANEEDDEEEIQVQNVVEPMRIEKNAVKFSISRGGKPPLPPRTKDMKLTVCRDIQKGSNRTGKKKISLQDPVALRV
ncbi:hypothetical protein IFM89_035318 [Coptis chinensis]|uniref:Uncharacterized protein n=1 Tax=Coptis chinensis TaxID=261450 RepID=A0A835IJ07_9MAGN|nr:hypothetical protein IFM89_035318 [Coptis chinensis]